MEITMIRYSRPLALMAIFLFSSATSAATFTAGTYSNGEYSMRFDADGHFHVTAGKDKSVDGTYTTQGDEIKLTDVSGNIACEKDIVGKFKWTYTDTSLKFEMIDDKCSERADDLTAQPWKKQ